MTVNAPPTDAAVDARHRIDAERRRGADMIDVPGTGARVTVEAEGIVEVLGPAGTWRDGVTPLTVRRNELPVLDRNGAEVLLRDVVRLCEQPQPAEPGIVARVKKAARR